MTRYEFLKKSGFTGASLMALLSCVKEEDKYVTALTLLPEKEIPVNTTQADTKLFVSSDAIDKIANPKAKINLTQSNYAGLVKIGAYAIVNGFYVVALAKNGSYIAANLTCTHEPKKKMVFENEEWLCTEHGARFTQKGAGLNKNGSNGLAVYKTATDGKTLVIY